VAAKLTTTSAVSDGDRQASLRGAQRSGCNGDAATAHRPLYQHSRVRVVALIDFAHRVATDQLQRSDLGVQLVVSPRSQREDRAAKQAKLQSELDDQVGVRNPERLEDRASFTIAAIFFTGVSREHTAQLFHRWYHRSPYKSVSRTARRYRHWSSRGGPHAARRKATRNPGAPKLASVDAQAL
jgi:hypothetical protein